MGDHIVILTDNYRALKLLRFDNQADAENAYQKYKSEGFGAIKARIEKAHELNIVNI
ncbi:hypothetical protein OYT88_11825 [Sporolactobacillus sp. CQH2019]|uniref:hypothetical protein n=1 Tax=Sporolactobacillus sp. CQH2019 TaxID=3023512 RepID=UPI0023684986|nr:hypothetical protein [Sporolactobacillus sp. CQH2019]MDD9149242.1 hypothetical protein [Sporolactobacillus sp. CQH2019]